MPRPTFNPKSLLNLKHQRPNRLDRQSFVDRLQLRISPVVSEKLSLIPVPYRNDLLRQWIEDGLNAHIKSDQSDLASDLIDELTHDTTGMPELSGLLELCNGSVEDATAVIQSVVRVDYHHPVDWVNELAKAHALVAAYRLGHQQQSETPNPKTNS